MIAVETLPVHAPADIAAPAAATPRALRWEHLEAAVFDLAGLELDPLAIADARLHHCRFDGATARASLRASVLRACTFVDTAFEHAEFAADTRIEGSSFRGARWRGGTIAARFEACELARVEARGVEFAVPSVFARCRLGGYFERCTFRGAFTGCDLADAEFRDCAFEGVRFEDCRFPPHALRVDDWHGLSARAREHLAGVRLEPAARAACVGWIDARVARAHLTVDDLVDARDLAARFGPATGRALFELLSRCEKPS
jgi:uncharacterized protein YjbI with pentapeptide repeats